MQNKIKMCIIGAGPSGLCTAKEIQANNPNIDIKVFEKSNNIGGIFANCYQDLTLVNNPFLVSFSDFPPTTVLSFKMETSLRSELRMISPEKFCLFFRGISLDF
jgi:protoporphyrinogen oxidase